MQHGQMLLIFRFSSCFCRSRNLVTPACCTGDHTVSSINPLFFIDDSAFLLSVFHYFWQRSRGQEKTVRWKCSYTTTCSLREIFLLCNGAHGPEIKEPTFERYTSLSEKKVVNVIWRHQSAELCCNCEAERMSCEFCPCVFVQVPGKQIPLKPCACCCLHGCKRCFFSHSWEIRPVSVGAAESVIFPVWYLTVDMNWILAHVSRLHVFLQNYSAKGWVVRVKPERAPATSKILLLKTSCLNHIHLHLFKRVVTVVINNTKLEGPG